MTCCVKKPLLCLSSVFKTLIINVPANQGGYNLLSANKMQDAIFVFQLNTKLYPKSANAWDSLGEAYWKSKQPDKAVENYIKAMELDPRVLPATMPGRL